MTKFIKSIVILVYCLVLFSCNPEENEVQTTPIHNYPSNESTAIVWTVPSKNVLFEYDIAAVKGDALLKIVRYKLINKSNESVNFVMENSGSSNFYIVAKGGDFKVDTKEIGANSWKRIVQLLPGDMSCFTFHMRTDKISENFQLGFDFRSVNRFIPNNVLQKNPYLIDDILNAPMDSSKIIWGKRCEFEEWRYN